MKKPRRERGVRPPRPSRGERSTDFMSSYSKAVEVARARMDEIYARKYSIKQPPHKRVYFPD